MPESLICSALAAHDISKDIVTAVMLAGAYEGVSTWHEGMGLEKSMNAKQMAGYLYSIPESRLPSLMEQVQSINVRRGRMKVEDAERYERLMRNPEFSMQLKKLKGSA